MLKKLTKKQQAWVESTFRKLTLNEKIGQLVNERGSYVMSRDLPAEKWLKKYPVGSIFTGSEIIEAYAGKDATLHHGTDARH